MAQKVIERPPSTTDRKSTRLNSSHSQISYAVFCLKKKKKTIGIQQTSAHHPQTNHLRFLLLADHFHPSSSYLDSGSASSDPFSVTQYSAERPSMLCLLA